ncbi:MAG TPA: twin-arginine translocation signal domain-containing protein [Beijerinckiaceae bacterium]|jgi:TAT (twin-arginine translocation) pathway signal sequence|nr:twin-arginine translocation signal domain-containing protein [Beijerinckiaceae bacterium]
MDRRGFLKVALGVTGAAAALASLPAQAIPMARMPQTGPLPGEAPAAAIATPEDIADAKVENVYWGWRRRRYWRHRYWRHRYWRRRRWGYRRWGYYRPWRRRYWGWGWRRRYWW